MSERLLKALMQLFAIIANPESKSSNRKPIVESFLNEQLNSELVDEYLKLFDEYYELHHKKVATDTKKQKKTAASSVKVLMICNVINQELTQKQKIIVLIRLLEFINTDGDITDQEMEFVSTVSDAFNISKEEFDELKNFVLNAVKIAIDSDKILLINNKEKISGSSIKHIHSDALIGQIYVFHVLSVNMHVFVFEGENELYLNGQLLLQNRVHILSAGSSIRNSKIKPIYYSDIISTYTLDKSKARIVFEVDNIEYKFGNGSYGLHKMSFLEKSGKLVGIMGASGAGKSTLLNLLNGNYPPTSGTVYINGINIHSESDKIEGLIGYVSQDDLLMEDLTVFQNIYYNAKLCFDNYTHFQLLRVTHRILKSLGLYGIRNMKVGSPLNKKISGGQRKRLNIALELIREPAVLFLDEPTSGLSSRDSENIIDLLKELTLKGKLVFVVIHQPSSDIFKMFDRLIILDTGGFLIYSGDPIDSIIYFKSRMRQANWNDSECSLCGNVNPEQVFNIVENRVVDEFGNTTQTRKTSPKEWHDHYISFIKNEVRRSILVKKLPEINFKIPGKLKQFNVFVVRDVLSKLSNAQYLAINLLETPILALLLSYIIKFYTVNATNEEGYTLLNNSNLPVYIFMSVIVALFIGLTVAAEEIIKDRKILKREAFLNLSKSSYLLSKVAILFTLSAFQAFTYVIIGNSIMEIKGMYLEYWLVLFSTWCFSNILGLNISDGFKTSITIYILIPFLIIPQIILSGVMVKFDKLNPVLSSQSTIPLYGEIITARWAYEALAVYQFKENKFEKGVYEFEKKKSVAGFKKDFWITKLDGKILYYQRNSTDPSKKEQIEKDFELLRNELKKETSENKKIKLSLNIDKLRYGKDAKGMIDTIKNYLTALKSYYVTKYNEVDKEKDRYVSEQQKSDKGKAEYIGLKKKYHNDQLTEFVTNSNEQERIVEFDGHLYQKIDYIYLDPKFFFIKAHFYAPVKRVFGKYFDTFWVNIFVMWTMCVFLYITLYFSFLKKFLEFGERLNFNWKLKKEEKSKEKIVANKKR